MLRILHISDVHIGEEGDLAERYAVNIPVDINSCDAGEIDCVVMTGDVYDGRVPYTTELRDKAVSFFNELLSEINENQPDKKITKDDFIFVPGNHDLDRDAADSERWHKYRDFLETFYEGKIPKFYYSNEDFSLFKTYDGPEQKIAFVGFNSCKIKVSDPFNDEYLKQMDRWLVDDILASNSLSRDEIKKLFVEMRESGKVKDYDDYGLVTTSHLANMLRRVEKLDAGYTVVALFHHHFTLFPETAEVVGDRSLIRNHSELLKYLNLMNVKVIMHGHKHYDLERPYVMDTKLNEERIMYIFAGGSACSNRIDDHSFAVLDLYPEKEKQVLKHTKINYKGEKRLAPITQIVPDEESAPRIDALITLLKRKSTEKYKKYEQLTDELYASTDDVATIVEWVGDAISDFGDASEELGANVKNVLFLLFAINLRTVSYMKIMGKDSEYYEEVSDKIKAFAKEEVFDGNFKAELDDFYNIFEEKDLRNISSMAEVLLENTNKYTRKYVSWAILGIFFTDLYLVFTRYPDEFKNTIESKISIKMPKKHFVKHVPKKKLSVQSNYDRRCAFINLYCSDATAHKMAVIFIKEFELIINSLEEYFRMIGLKLYYLKPGVKNDMPQYSLKDYSFEAFIPTLLPLLTGKKIYNSRLVFARELIQNAIDAIAVREATDKASFAPQIDINIGVEEDGRRFFRIIDNGTGMDQFKIERYFTSIGRSYYSGTEYADLDIEYKPISEFGIGFLSSFMAGKEIIVRTKYYESPKSGLKLHIPNYDGCFFLEEDETKKTTGTEVTIYMDKELTDDICDEDIYEYIETHIRDTHYPIFVTYINSEQGKSIKKDVGPHAIRHNQVENELCFFVPLYPNGEIGNGDTIAENMDKAKYGVMLRNGKREGGAEIMNAGILIEKAELDDVFKMGRFSHKNYHELSIHHVEEHICETLVNLPPNWVTLEVSRDIIQGVLHAGNKKTLQVTKEVASELYSQVANYISDHENVDTNVPSLFMQDIVSDILHFSCIDGELFKNVNSLLYNIIININADGIKYRIQRKGLTGEADNQLIVHGKCPSRLISRMNVYLGNIQEDYRSRKMQSRMIKERISSDNLINLLKRLCKEDRVFTRDDEEFVRRLYVDFYEVIDAIKNNEKSDTIMQIASLLLLGATMNEQDLYTGFFMGTPVASIIEHLILMNFTVGNESMQEIEVKYDDIAKLIVE